MHNYEWTTHDPHLICAKHEWIADTPCTNRICATHVSWINAAWMAYVLLLNSVYKYDATAARSFGRILDLHFSASTSICHRSQVRFYFQSMVSPRRPCVISHTSFSLPLVQDLQWWSSISWLLWCHRRRTRKSLHGFLSWNNRDRYALLASKAGWWRQK